jgi:hypothetical protein
MKTNPAKCAKPLKAYTVSAAKSAGNMHLERKWNGKAPFSSVADEMDAIEARVAVWRLKARRFHRTKIEMAEKIKLFGLITDAEKFLAQCRVARL